MLSSRQGDPLSLIKVRTPGYDQLSVRSWWPAIEEEWIMAKSYSYWGIADVGLTLDAWASFPKISAAELQPHLFPI